MKTQNVVAEIFLFFGILFMFMIWALPEGLYFIVPATFSVICFVFALRLYKPVKKEAKVRDMKEQEVLDILDQFEEYDRKKYESKQIG